jgi:naphthalene 1,2-dioxygenase system ferredoxin subunit
VSENWTYVAELDAVPEGEAIDVQSQGRSVALYCVEGQVYATAGLCTHQKIRLCDGFLEGFEIECPLHQGRFDIRTGKALCAPLIEDIRTYPVKIEDGKVLVGLPSA